MNINDTLQFQNIGLPDDILRRKLYGDFDGAIRLIDRRLNDPTTPQALAYSLKVQKEMIRLLPQEYPYTREDALAIIREKIPDFTEAEFDELVDDRRIYWIYNKGEMRNNYYFYKVRMERANDNAVCYMEIKTKIDDVDRVLTVLF